MSRQSAANRWKYYDVLGVQKTATTDEIKKAFRTKAQTAHPDKGGDAETFKQLARAYEVLINPHQRRLYDLFGDQQYQYSSSAAGASGSSSGHQPHSNNQSRDDSHLGLGSSGKRTGGMGGGIPFTKTFSFGEFFNIFVSATMPTAPPPPPSSSSSSDGSHSHSHTHHHHHHHHPGQNNSSSKPNDVLFPVQITLRDLFICAEKKIKIKKTVACYKCNGLGGRQIVCHRCEGTGYTSRINSNSSSAAGAVHGLDVARMTCDTCNLKGFTLDPICDVCRGDQTVKISNVVAIPLQPGQDMDELVRVTGVLDDKKRPEESSDLVIRLVEVEDDVFKRVPGGDGHLLVDKTISLADALVGFQFSFRHLDDRPRLVQCQYVLRPGTVQVVRNEGMPRKDGSRGHLYFRFQIQFPTHLGDDMKLKIRQALPGATLNSKPPGDVPKDAKALQLEPDDGASLKPDDQSSSQGDDRPGDCIQS